jgi:hypothetical protein
MIPIDLLMEAMRSQKIERKQDAEPEVFTYSEASYSAQLRKALKCRAEGRAAVLLPGRGQDGQ